MVLIDPLSGSGFETHRRLATSDLIDQAQFALDVTARALPVYEQMFDIEYPLSKLDTLVAHDFDAGAMENWVGHGNLFIMKEVNIVRIS